MPARRGSFGSPQAPAIDLSVYRLGAPGATPPAPVPEFAAGSRDAWAISISHERDAGEGARYVAPAPPPAPTVAPPPDVLPVPIIPSVGMISIAAWRRDD